MPKKKKEDDALTAIAIAIILWLLFRFKLPIFGVFLPGRKPKEEEPPPPPEKPPALPLIPPAPEPIVPPSPTFWPSLPLPGPVPVPEPTIVPPPISIPGAPAPYPFKLPISLWPRREPTPVITPTPSPFPDVFGLKKFQPIKYVPPSPIIQVKPEPVPYPYITLFGPFTTDPREISFGLIGILAAPLVVVAAPFLGVAALKIGATATMGAGALIAAGGPVAAKRGIVARVKQPKLTPIQVSRQVEMWKSPLLAKLIKKQKGVL